MNPFPKAKILPDDVIKTRKERLRHLVKTTSLGILIRSTIIIAEMVGFALFSSYSLLMDALASLVDIVSSILLIVFIRLAAKPPDANHPFGHGRVEPLIGLQLGIFLTLLGFGMLLQQVFEVSTPADHPPLSPYAFIIPMAAFFFLEICYFVLLKVANKYNSPALYAEAAHYRIDSISCALAMCALLAGAFIPVWSGIFDHIGAISIAILMVVLGINASKINIKQLIDQVPDKDFFTLVRQAALEVDGVKDTEKIRIQQSGPNAHVDIDVEVDPALNVVEAHEISQNVRVAIQKAWPCVQDVTVHIEPYYPGDH